MNSRIEIYEHALVTARAKQVLGVLVTAFALVIGLWSVPAQAANGLVAGTVTDADGNPLADVDVAVVWWHDTSDPHWDTVGYDATGPSGDYAIDAPQGTVRVYFFGDAEHAGEWYDDAVTFADATDLSLADGGNVSADAALAEYGHLGGHVELMAEDPRAQAVALLDPVTGAVRARTSVDENGDYSFGQVVPGSYKVSFNRLSGFALSAAEFWDDKAEHLGPGAADLVTVGPGATVSDVDATLVEGGHITGTLKDGAGNPLACRVQAFTADGTLVMRSVTSASDGSFDISGLSTGSYLVRVVPWGPCHDGTQYRQDGGGALTNVLAQADPVAVTLGGTSAAGAALVYQVAPQPTVTNTGSPQVFVQPVPGQPFYDHPVVGSALGAAVGGWSPNPTGYAYAWLADGAPITGATASTYVPVAADLGKSISVRVLASRPGYQTGSAVSPPMGPVTHPPIRNIALPKMAQTVRVGRWTRAYAGSWSVPDTTYTYTWRTGSTVLLVSSQPRFRVPAVATAQGLTITITAAKDGYAPGTATSAVRMVQLGGFRVREKVALVGEARVGRTLKVAGKVTPRPEKAVYIWQRDGEKIAGARGRTYSLVSGDVGHRITVRVRYTSPGFKPFKETNAPTAVVQR